MLKKTIILLIIFPLLLGCSPSLYTQGKKLSSQGMYSAAIEHFQKQLLTNSNNAQTWREMGIAQYKLEQYQKARESLNRANQIKQDPMAYLYIGLIQERDEEYDDAISAYSMALSLKPSSDLKSSIRGHIDHLISKRLRRDVDQAIQNESKIQISSIPENTIAVVNFDGSHLSPEIAPISAGLAEFTSIDLSKISSIRVVERLKIDAITNELKLAATQYTDPKYAPKMGRLLGSRKIVTGSLTGIGDKNIRLDGAIVSTADSISATTEPTEGKLKNFFKIQKDFTFKIIDQLGITLSSEERNAIKKVPTESYLAFLAYCRGIDYRNRGMYGEAFNEFNNAAGQDAGFVEAQMQAQAMTKANQSEPTDPLADFESIVDNEKTEQNRKEQALDTRLSTAINNSGAIPGLSVNSAPLSQEGMLNTEGTGTVIIGGNPDAQ